MKRHTLYTNSIAEVLHNDHGHTTGFALRLFRNNEPSNKTLSQHYYIIIVLQGAVTIDCSHYRHARVEAGEMAFMPKGSLYQIESLERTSKALFFAFDTTLIRMDDKLFNYFVRHAADKPYEFNLLRMNDQMTKVVDMIVSQMTGHRKINITEICSTWNTLIFATFATFYKRTELLDFFRPMMHARIDFRTFIENNYIEADGNVERLLRLSGLSEYQFRKRLNEEFGANPKEWLTEQMKRRILHLAKVGDTTPTEIARKVQMSQTKFFKFCRKHFDCTATELIAHMQASTDAASSGERCTATELITRMQGEE